VSAGQLQWTLDELGTLDEVAFTAADVPAPGPDSYSVAVWFRAVDTQRMQVLCNHGAMSQAAPGWTLYLRDGHLHASVTAADGTSAAARLPLEDAGRWMHAAAVIDRAAGTLRLYLDGSPAAGEPLPSAPITPDGDLIAGGYTDPAGGHFDHTFGRGGSGYLDDLRLYGYALTDDEIALLARAGLANGLPAADFHIDAGQRQAPLTVRFDASPSQGAGIRAYLWDFGDGQTGLGAEPQHHYLYAGTYTVRLTVIDADYHETSAEETLTLGGQPNPLQIRPVFVNGAEGYACYRIPAIVRATDGSLVAFAEGRVASCSDSTPAIHIVSKRSTDHGHTWSPLQVVARNILEGRQHAAQNVSAVVDEVHGSGRIVVVYKKHEVSEWERARGVGVSRAFCAFSDDHGASWQDERDITDQVHRPYNPAYAHICPAAANPENQAHDWRIHVPPLGHAIQLQGTPHNPATRGRLFFAGSYTAGEVSVFAARSFVFWSDDLGQTWRIGGVHEHPGLNESSAVELEDGRVMINSRAYSDDVGVGCRAVTIAAFDAAGCIRFEGTTYDRALVDPAVQGSILRYSRSDQARYGGKGRLLFSNPNHPRARVNMTVRLSYDEGRTWAYSKTVDRGPSSYSDLVVQNDGRIGLLYERGNQGGIAYVDFSLEWLTDGQDRLDDNSTEKSVDS
jgi:sialidase-1